MAEEEQPAADTEQGQGPPGTEDYANVADPTELPKSDEPEEG
jgi:hypothetical protein